MLPAVLKSTRWPPSRQPKRNGLPQNHWRAIGGPIPINRFSRFLPRIGPILGVEAARHRKYVVGIVPDFFLVTARPDEALALAVALPLGAGKHGSEIIALRTGFGGRIP